MCRVTVGSHEARTHFAELLDRVAKGERITITRHGVPVAEIVPPGGRSRSDIRDAIAKMHELGKGKSLGGITIKELIEEGRRS